MERRPQQKEKKTTTTQKQQTSPAESVYAVVFFLSSRFLVEGRRESTFAGLEGFPSPDPARTASRPPSQSSKEHLSLRTKFGIFHRVALPLWTAWGERKMFAKATFEAMLHPNSSQPLCPIMQTLNPINPLP